MSFAGNLFSNFAFHPAKITWTGRDALPPPGLVGSLDQTFSSSSSLSSSSSTIVPPQVGWFQSRQPAPTPAPESPPLVNHATVHFDLTPIHSASSGFEPAAISAVYNISTTPPSLVMPPSSVFAGQPLAEAQKYFVELYTAFCGWPHHWTAVRIKRTSWNVVAVDHGGGGDGGDCTGGSRYDFMNGSSFFPAGSCHLDSAFYVADLDYHWFSAEKHAYPKQHSDCV
eukprot:gnl/Spiro4/11440_TR6042_c0_g1_i2.p1 gnl/Spiro4/11440_TR6042_c0_g1~~gnl/Spiro4/11440_TR6042_c0_g1_i2.p1  ORF type:complete len:226 (+),score=56.17 gnl/Spiro4/11440_TR6042_c0_g1_i2:480-1157(+)